MLVSRVSFFSWTSSAEWVCGHLPHIRHPHMDLPRNGCIATVTTGSGRARLSARFRNYGVASLESINFAARVAIDSAFMAWMTVPPARIEAAM